MEFQSGVAYRVFSCMPRPHPGLCGHDIGEQDFLCLSTSDVDRAVAIIKEEFVSDSGDRSRFKFTTRCNRRSGRRQHDRGPVHPLDLHHTEDRPVAYVFTVAVHHLHGRTPGGTASTRRGTRYTKALP